MTTPHLVAPGRVIVTRGFSRLRYGLTLGVIGVAVAAFMLASVAISHGVYAVIVLTLCAVAMALWGGPERLARRITVHGDGLHIERFHRVSTTIEWGELAEASTRVTTDRRGGTRAELVLEPADAVAFFHRHRELRAAREGDVAVVPAGRSSPTAAELTDALDTLQPKNRRR